jgi:fatty acid desaturase
MAKKIKKLEKETAMYRQRWEASNKALLTMAEEVPNCTSIIYSFTIVLLLAGSVLQFKRFLFLLLLFPLASTLVFLTFVILCCSVVCQIQG